MSVTGAVAAVQATQAASTPAAPANDVAAELRELRAEVTKLRDDNNRGHAATAGNTGRMARTLDDVTAASGGEAISTTGMAA